MPVLRRKTTREKVRTGKALTGKALTGKDAAVKKAQERQQHTTSARVNGVLRKLAPLAKEIKIRLSKADAMEGTAFDHRLSAAYQLAEAQKIAKDEKIDFKEWCETVLGRPYNTVRKLVRVGLSNDPAQALEDMRGRNKTDNKTFREREKSKGKAATSREVNGPELTPSARITSGFRAIKEDEGVNIVQAQAERYGLQVVSPDEAQAARAAHEVAKYGPVEQIKTLFESASAHEKLIVVNFVVASVGASLTNGFPILEDEDTSQLTRDQLTDIPPHLTRGRGSRRKAGQAA
jgi:hypothetical protein